MERVLKHCRRMILAKKQPQPFVAINERFLALLVDARFVSNVGSTLCSCELPLIHTRA
jgi:hypothetical protein